MQAVVFTTAFYTIFRKSVDKLRSGVYNKSEQGRNRLGRLA